MAKAEEATSKAAGSHASAGDAPESQNGTAPESPGGKGPVPHRWVIVGAMALAFVLCNMDKVLPYFLARKKAAGTPKGGCDWPEILSERTMAMSAKKESM